MTRPSHLRVIDCSSYNVILAPKDVQYAALSYQWGNKSSTFDLATNKKLPTLLPATIKDSIAATLSLGLQYLWVDAYCILQNDEEDFKNQIRQMDLIYQFASITIFAVTGTSSDSGLSGLSYTGSRFQADSMFRGFRLLTFSTKTTQSIQVSGWHSRAWTFQESFFSRRRLFFAEDQILFDCEEGTAAESHTHCRKGPILSKWHLDMSDLRIYVLIQEFSNRHLTFPADILNAFEGVLNSFRNQQPGFKTYWGIPMSLAYVHESSNCSANFLLGLSWGSIGQTGELYRRAGFPSWSWAGWIGPINYQLVYITSEIELEGCSEWKVDKESDDHSEKSWRETECNTSTHCQEMKTSQRLRISGPSLRVILRKVKYGASFGINVSLSLNQSSECRVCSLNLNGRFDELDMLHGSSDTDTRTCFAICLYSYNKLICHAGEKVLLLVSRRRSHWERVGICVAPFETKEEASSFEDQLRATPSFQTRDFCIQ
ncbi:hypothetical protein HYFRA_00007399 [Hymenoscyphus fraxineus]|uniref:Heterokaryon incompatibility domain-containing protein n=1 Tax=Hymenoscyphus fraxineus TaxID=746836 RepID=A0A9N9KR33_9HELO|nr:hypothetical protein HYFRA_00007399 [Hymenoscyphus fraxineus]